MVNINLVLDEKLPELKAQLFKKHVYRLGKGKSLLGFEPEYDAIAHPENKQLLKREITECECLGETSDGKTIYLYRYKLNSVVLREIGRLRELTFRTVKEGTGLRRDIDRFDHYYDHIILWDDNDLEIVGAYRMAQTAVVLANDSDTPKLYTQTLFDYTPEFNRYLKNGLELGRSFVQPKYWGMRSLDYLWYGIGAYLRKFPDIEYMFGPVSISQSYSEKAMDLLVYFYSTYFPAQNTLVTAKKRYQYSSINLQTTADCFSSNHDYKSQFTTLKSQLAASDESVPTLFKQYTELCDAGGVSFAAFNVDEDFSNCVDGFIVIDINKIKDAKKKRYIG